MCYVSSNTWLCMVSLPLYFLILSWQHVNPGLYCRVRGSGSATSPLNSQYRVVALTFLWCRDCHAASCCAVTVPLVTALGTQLLDTDRPLRTAVSDFVSIETVGPLGEALLSTVYLFYLVLTFIGNIKLDLSESTCFCDSGSSCHIIICKMIIFLVVSLSYF